MDGGSGEHGGLEAEEEDGLEEEWALGVEGNSLGEEKVPEEECPEEEYPAEDGLEEGRSVQLWCVRCLKAKAMPSLLIWVRGQVWVR